MVNLFVIVSGLPGSGKTTLGRLLAPALGLALIDKDEILEGLFESKGAGDAAWRRALSRESDLLFQAEAAASAGAVLVSHWRVPGMPPGSGTPTGWISNLPGRVVHVQCVCPVELAAERFLRRRRHPGHLDHERAITDLTAVAPLDLEPPIDVDTTHPPDLESILRQISTLTSR